MAAGVIRSVKSVVVFSYCAVLYSSHKLSIETIPAERMALRLGVRLPFCSEGGRGDDSIISQLDESREFWLSILADVAAEE